jgi:uncharacterized protein (DUF2235 family)
MPKNIVVFSDGTGQEGGRRFNTNVYKLYNMVEDRTGEQIAFYDHGVGTGLRLLSGMVSGRGFSRNVHDCYRFVFENFRAGDRLFLIGFSRGAATVRSLSYFIHLFGILPHSRPELIPRAWSIYRIRDSRRREQKARNFIRRHHTMWSRVHFLGCYDTVAALGLPSQIGSVLLDRVPGMRHRFHRYTLSPSVTHAYHALAIDDMRSTFHPLLWDAEVEDYQTVRQVWFAGMHTDVGGGYRKQRLSDIPLVWLTDMAVRHGLRIWPEHRVRIREDADGSMHDSRGTRFTRLYRKAQRSWDAATQGAPLVHASVLARSKTVHNRPGEYQPWVLQGEYAVEPWVRYPDQPWYVSAEQRHARRVRLPGVRISEAGPQRADTGVAPAGTPATSQDEE